MKRFQGWLVVFIMAMAFAPGRVSAQAQGPVISLSGQIAYIHPDGNVWLLDGATGQRAPLTRDASDGGLRYFGPRWSPDGQMLIFSRLSESGGQEEVFLLQSGSSEPRRLDPINNARSLAWAPDGKSITFLTGAVMGPNAPGDYQPGVWSYELGTGAVTLLHPAPEGYPPVSLQWSPTGAVYSFQDFCFECVGVFHTVERASGIRYDWLMARDEPWVGLAYDWSPDGSQIAYDQWDYYNPPGGTYALWAGSVDGQMVRQVYAVEGKAVYGPKWSPDGGRIAMSLITVTDGERGWTRRAELAVVRADGSDGQVLFQAEEMLHVLSWSPDGKQVLFIQERPEDYLPDLLTIFDLERNEATVLDEGLWYGGAEWSPAGAQPFALPQPQPLPAQVRAVRPPFAVDEDTLVYTAADGALALFHLASRQTTPLTEPGRVKDFWLSPKQKHALLQSPDGSLTLLDMAYQFDGSLTVRERPLQHRIEAADYPWFPEFVFSPREDQFAYRDGDGLVWLVGNNGAETQLAYIAGLPQWSADGAWMSFVSTGRRLYVARSGEPFQVVAENAAYGGPVPTASGSPMWSPGAALLAYTIDPNQGPGYDFENPETGEVWLYDPTSGAKTRLMERASTAGWSQDGRLLAARRLVAIGASAVSWTGYVIEPASGNWHEVGEYNSRGPDRYDWLPSESAYVYAAYRIADDFSQATRLAPTVLEVSPDGSAYLTVDELGFDKERVPVYCASYQGQRTQIAELETGPIYGAVMPGIWGSFSPDGQWALIYYYSEPDVRTMAARCDGQASAELLQANNLQGWPVGSYQFSYSSRWLAVVLNQGSAWELQARPVDAAGVGTALNLPMADKGKFFWLRAPALPPAPTPTPTLEPTASAVPTRTAPTSPAAPDDLTAEPSPNKIPTADLSNQVLTAGPTRGMPLTGPRVADEPAGGLPWGLDRFGVAPLAVLGVLGAVTGGGVLLALALVIFRPRGGAAQPAPQQPAPQQPAPQQPASQPFAPHADPLEEAAGLVEAGQYRTAFERLKTLVERRPLDGATWYWMGLAALGDGQVRTAKRCLLRASQLGHRPADKALEGLR